MPRRPWGDPSGRAWRAPGACLQRLCVACLVVAPGVQGLASAPTGPYPASDAFTQEERAWLDRHGPIRVLVVNASEPVNFMDNGTFRGIGADFLAIMAVQTGLAFEIVALASSGQALQAARDGRGDIITSLPPTPERSTAFDFTPPYIEATVSFWTRSGTAPPTDSPAVRIAALAGTPFEAQAQGRFPNATFVAVPDTLAGLRGLQNRTLDAFLTPDLVAGYIARGHGVYDVVPASPRLSAVAAGIAVRKGEPILLGIMTKALDGVSHESRTAIFTKWTGLDLTPGARGPAPALPRWIPYAAGGLVLAVLLLGGASVVLRRQVGRRTREIAEREAREVRLRALKDDLERSNKDLAQFAYVASHDLQEPLRMVAGFTELLAQRYGDKLDPDGHAYIAFASDGAKRMQQLISDLLEYSRVTTRGLPLQPVDAAVPLEAALANLSAAIAESGTALERGPMPKVMADAPQLARVFQNLVGNAIKFRGPDPPRVRVACRVEGGEAVFSVQDNGIGIDPQYQGKLFQLFQRLHTREAYPGTGLGLAISKRIVERHGGRIWLESEVGRGTTVSFTLQVTGGVDAHG